MVRLIMPGRKTDNAWSAPLLTKGSYIRLSITQGDEVALSGFSCVAESATVSHTSILYFSAAQMACI